MSATEHISVIRNLSKRDVVITLQPGAVETGSKPSVESVKVRLKPANPKDDTDDSSILRLRLVCEKHGLDHAEVSKMLSRGTFLEQMRANGTLAVA